jgi:hypothetical protein
MNEFTDMVFIFVFVYLVVYYGIIDIADQNIVVQKFYMFIAVFTFATILEAMKSIRRKYPIHMWKIVGNGLLIGMLAFIGQTFMYDINYMEDTRPIIDNMKDVFSPPALFGVFIVSAIAVGKSVRYIFNTDYCLD